MREPELPNWMNPRTAAQIAQLRALGHTQVDIAEQLGITQQTVSRYMKGIREASEQAEDFQEFLLGLLLLGLGVGAMIMLAKAFSE